MLRALIKIVGFVIIIAAATLGIARIKQSGETIDILAFGYQISLGPVQILLLSAVLALALWLGLKLIGLAISLWHFINGDETALSRYFAGRRERKGLQALTNTLMAMTAGDGKKAMAEANRSAQLLNAPRLTALLQAQAAVVAQDSNAAAIAFEALIDDPQTRFAGITGAMRQRLALDDRRAALKLAEHGAKLQPKNDAILKQLFALQTQSGDWAGATETLALQLKAGHIPRDLHRRRSAVLLMAKSKSNGDDNASMIEANRLSPDLIPAAAAAADQLIKAGQIKEAEKILKKAWKSHPHPDLAAAFAAIDPDETAEGRATRFAPLIKLHPDHRETVVLQAQLMMAMGDMPGAKRALKPLAEADADAQICTLMAAITRDSHAAESRAWLAKAISAPAAPAWVCDKCGHPHENWGPICENCSSVDSLSWAQPTTHSAPRTISAQVLALLEDAQQTDPKNSPID